MDAQGIDVEAISINPFWYGAERDLAEKLIKLQNEKLAELCATNPDRFVAFATTAMQHPDLAVQQLEYGVKKLGLRGMSVGTHVDGQDLSDPKFHPIWAKCEEMGLLVFMHPIAYAPFEKRLGGNGGLVNIIGNPLETTVALTHMIFEGTLDRYPKLKLCTSHAGGYLGSYGDRSDAGCITFPDRCKAVPLKKKPTEYLKDLYYDTIIFNPEALRYLASRVGVSQIMLGTDYPFPWAKGGATVDIILNTPGLSDDDKRAMLGGSAAKLLGLKHLADGGGRTIYAPSGKRPTDGARHERACRTQEPDRRLERALQLFQRAFGFVCGDPDRQRQRAVGSDARAERSEDQLRQHALRPSWLAAGETARSRS